MKRTTRMQLAQETVEIVNRGNYKLPDGRKVSIQAMVEECLQDTHFHEPNDYRRLREEALTRPAFPGPASVELRNETTLEGIGRTLAEHPNVPLATLNFASAKNPGGGFLGGSQAQEESLARSSALYASLLTVPEYYARHRAMSSCLYTDAMIVSPGCPVFRTDEGDLLEAPRRATFITCAAPNAGAVAKNTPKEMRLLPDVLRQRAENVLCVAAHGGYRHLLLGAWGCGVFQNDPELVAGIFADLLAGGGLWADRFEKVVFSVLDHSADQAIFSAFKAKFARRSRPVP
ncbi:TIGR02452 family protein [Zavarzinella formosa]|uniref:TIGR02452 family protein n=1 Tax=Zavarzinella formosa TaxID=360055 RepID=UPI00031BCDF1|nr:TIGR02452 family protein [Zavarzinella formosa]